MHFRHLKKKLIESFRRPFLWAKCPLKIGSIIVRYLFHFCIKWVGNAQWHSLSFVNLPHHNCITTLKTKIFDIKILDQKPLSTITFTLWRIVMMMPRLPRDTQTVKFKKEYNGMAWGKGEMALLTPLLTHFYENYHKKIVKKKISTLSSTSSPFVIDFILFEFLGPPGNIRIIFLLMYYNLTLIFFL